MQIPPRADRPANFGDRGALVALVRPLRGKIAEVGGKKQKNKNTARVSRDTQGGFVLSRAASEELVALVLALFYRGCGTTVTPRVLDRINSEQVSTCILHPSQVCPFQEPGCKNFKEKKRKTSRVLPHVLFFFFWWSKIILCAILYGEFFFFSSYKISFLFLFMLMSS